MLLRIICFLTIMWPLRGADPPEAKLMEMGWSDLSAVGIIDHDKLPAGRMFASMVSCNADCNVTRGDTLFFFGGVTPHGATATVLALNTTINYKENNSSWQWNFYDMETKGKQWWAVRAPTNRLGVGDCCHTGASDFAHARALS